VQAGSTKREGKEAEREGVKEKTQAKEGTSREGEEGSVLRAGQQIQVLTSGSAACDVGAAFACADIVVVQRKGGERGENKKKIKTEC